MIPGPFSYHRPATVADAIQLLSTFGDGALFLKAFRQQNLVLSVLAERRFVNEKLTIFRLVPRPS